MKRFFLFFICLFPLNIYAVNLTKITMDSGASPIGQGIDIYANGNQQARLYLHAYGTDSVPDTKDILNNLTMYNNDTGNEINRDTFKDSSLYTISDHNFQNGLFNQSFMSKKDYNLKDTDCSSSSKCVTIPLYFQTNRTGNTALCAKIGDLSTCNESSDTPVIVNAHKPFIYGPKDFAAQCSTAQSTYNRLSYFTCKVQLLNNLSELRFINSVNVSSSNILANYPYTRILSRNKADFSFEFAKLASHNLNSIDTISVTGIDDFGNLIKDLSLSSNENHAELTQSCGALQIALPKGAVLYDYSIKHGNYNFTEKNTIGFFQTSYGPDVKINSIIPGIPGYLITHHQQNYCGFSAGNISTSVDSNSFGGNINFSNLTGNYSAWNPGNSGISMIYSSNLQKKPNIYLILDDGKVDKIDYYSLLSSDLSKFSNSDLKGLNSYKDQIKSFSSMASYFDTNKDSLIFFLKDNKNFLSCVPGNYSDCKLKSLSDNNYFQGALAQYGDKIVLPIDYWGYYNYFASFFILNDGTYLTYDFKPIPHFSGPKGLSGIWAKYANEFVGTVAAADGNQYMFINDGSNEDSVVIFNMNNGESENNSYKIGDIWPELRNHHIKAAILAPEKMN